MQTGDEVKIRRGKYKGQAGEVFAVKGEKVVLTMKDGEIEVFNHSNVIEPTEATITQGELAAIISSEASSGEPGGYRMDSLVHAIDSKYPGFAVRVGLPVPSQSGAVIQHEAGNEQWSVADKL